MRRPEADRIEDEIAQERRALLRELLESRVWIEVLRPILYGKMRAIERSLAIDQRRDLENIRFNQGRYAALAQFADLDPDDASSLKEE